MIVLFWSFRHSKQAKPTNFYQKHLWKCKRGVSVWMVEIQRKRYRLFYLDNANHLNWKSSKRPRKLWIVKSWKKTIQSLVNFSEKWFYVFFITIVIFENLIIKTEIFTIKNHNFQKRYQRIYCFLCQILLKLSNLKTEIIDTL